MGHFVNCANVVAQFLGTQHTQMSDLWPFVRRGEVVLAMSGLLSGYALLILLKPRVGPGYPLSAFAPPLSIQFVIFCSLLLFPFFFSHSFYLFSSIVHPIPFYQNRPTPSPGRRL